jgi:hypothetical protein
MEKLGVGPQETWMVGDNLEWEVVSPQRLGIHVIWHDGYGVGLPPDSPIRPDRIIKRAGSTHTTQIQLKTSCSSGIYGSEVSEFTVMSAVMSTTINRGILAEIPCLIVAL